MLNIIGTIMLFLAFGISIFSAIRINSTNIHSLRNVTAIFQCAPFLILTICFLIEDTSNQLVSQYVGEGLPIFYRISAVWGSRVGPILMWASIMGIITLIMSRQKNLSNFTIQIMNSWIAILFLVSLFLDPFSASASGLRRGEISPLLQTDLMVIHPPVVFLYYSLCLATATIAVSGVIRSESSEKIHSSMIQWARYSLLAGSVGIGLGGLWAYTVLDWGGYWAWDPVETGSLLPWLALLGILHARARRSSLRPFSYTPALAMISGALVFIDTNGNYVQDAGEITSTTNERGEFFSKSSCRCTIQFDSSHDLESEHLYDSCNHAIGIETCWMILRTLNESAFLYLLQRASF